MFVFLQAASLALLFSKVEAVLCSGGEAQSMQVQTQRDLPSCIQPRSARGEDDEIVLGFLSDFYAAILEALGFTCGALLYPVAFQMPTEDLEGSTLTIRAVAVLPDSPASYFVELVFAENRGCLECSDEPDEAKLDKAQVLAFVGADSVSKEEEVFNVRRETGGRVRSTFPKGVLRGFELQYEEEMSFLEKEADRSNSGRRSSLFSCLSRSSLSNTRNPHTAENSLRLVRFAEPGVYVSQ